MSTSATPKTVPEKGKKDAKRELSPTKEMSMLLEKKATIEKNLAQLEKQIHALETSYLEDTNHVGNLLRGWDGYLSSR